MDIGQRIKRIRLEKHLTQDELAFRIDTTKQTIYKYENGIVTNRVFNGLGQQVEIANSYF